MANPDGTERLCQAVYGHKAEPRDYLGGSEAHMLHDGADLIEALKARVERAEASVVRKDELLREAHGELVGHLEDRDEKGVLVWCRWCRARGVAQHTPRCILSLIAAELEGADGLS